MRPWQHGLYSIYNKVPKITFYYGSCIGVLLGSSMILDKLGVDIDESNPSYEIKAFVEKKYEELLKQRSELFFKPSNRTGDEVRRKAIRQTMIYYYFLVVILAPIIEEMIFRWPLLINSKLLLPSAALFGYGHESDPDLVENGNENNNWDYWWKYSAGIFGLTFGLYVIKYRTILPCIMVHMFHNFMEITASFSQLDYFDKKIWLLEKSNS